MDDVSLFKGRSDHYRFTDQYNKLADRVNSLLTPLYKECIQNNINPRELTYLICSESHFIESTEVLMNRVYERKRKLNEQ